MLSGEINVKGAKNAALKIIPAALLSKEKITIKNLPDIEDVSLALSLISDLGADVKRSKGQVEICCENINKSELLPEIANKFRASIMFVGPLLARFGEVKFPHPGGCVIGAGGRPIDIFLNSYERLGAEIIEGEKYYQIKAKKLTGCDYFFPLISVTGTESFILTAVLADGVTNLKNCAMEPEIEALAEYLNKQGAKIKGAGTPTITIEGVKELRASDFTIIPDRIETGSFAIMAAAAKSKITINDCNPEHVLILLNIFKMINIPFESGNDFIKILPAKEIKPYNVKTREYPGFPTDLQSPFTLLMTQANGSSLIHETIYDRRLMFTDMLMQMGADIIMCDPHRVVVNGPSKLYGKKLISPDLRAGITLLIAALIANGQTEIDNIYQINRGYENIDDRLRILGADIKCINSLKI
ncbi:MAG: MurA: UDP-N-acetylglucosamine 1-carboxyvinyltransferase [Candidatus Falkowbacteria bacterium GW2011_GWC2_38_22]|uniref:UDP-N-acetylglucosamine 1-carboxyvinyltransferase n=1 Tax=Candidatus Falkowbacteria bacterium GW2011_GWE1_38_31 TaxID=1618638 RepID=A0A0G0N1B7_9BACT|nr:MAG: MurA: UDP-N-acetylglucosamine 1-carboxyvinyltransferase [Candidatus Falkowbacteria bacterium GW2011_GWF2_38_1205]KKQ62086.1 MAG: MurA: UDP-N-acetylglucosamine 1-carboxyvinyltransferase [Candidatus Falkowbacteria bacterium GW2011_GWC2_38_22]KKQ64236.1 MAG: MurA: UDP-N-acetylglucosamine 1-carboxyvinyltransferase [Candidatus Falkowbacteria bacterium GW2011_GWF1_38_22]KKQ66213.1 MAG: MurA: UDP-N-acetylglucosamine 1-carboxyvinyltransferase [Candidatus Falkowbacteria bacterium GW2011_GWE2_38_2